MMSCSTNLKYGTSQLSRHGPVLVNVRFDVIRVLQHAPGDVKQHAKQLTPRFHGQRHVHHHVSVEVQHPLAHVHLGRNSDTERISVDP